MPLPGPPPTKPHDARRRSYVAAHSVLGFDGSTIRAVAPTPGLRYSVFVHDLPPSGVMNTPRSGLAGKRRPMAATHAMSGLRGCTTTRAIASVSLSPMCVNVLPASVLLNMPSPNDELWRLFGSPVPTYRIL